MRDRGNKDVIFANAIQDGVREPVQHKSVLTAPADRISQWSFQDTIDCMVDRERESLCSYLATLLVPLPRFDQFQIRFGMELDRSHPRRKSFALTSSQGIVATAPDSISRHLRSASSAHSSSTSGSGGGSRLSISKPANVARSLSGSSKASRKTSLRSRDIGQFYRERHRPGCRAVTRMACGRPSIFGYVDYSSRLRVRRISRTGGPHHFLTCPHIQHEHILRLSALCLAQSSASCVRIPNSSATRKARAITRWRWLRRSARGLRRCAVVSRSSCVIAFYSTSAQRLIPARPGRKTSSEFAGRIAERRCNPGVTPMALDLSGHRLGLKGCRATR